MFTNHYILNELNEIILLRIPTFCSLVAFILWTALFTLLGQKIFFRGVFDSDKIQVFNSLYIRNLALSFIAQYIVIVLSIALVHIIISNGAKELSGDIMASALNSAAFRNNIAGRSIIVVASCIINFVGGYFIAYKEILFHKMIRLKFSLFIALTCGCIIFIFFLYIFNAIIY